MSQKRLFSDYSSQDTDFGMLSQQSKKIAFGSSQPSVLDVVEAGVEAYSNPYVYGGRLALRTINQLKKKKSRYMPKQKRVGPYKKKTYVMKRKPGSSSSVIRAKHFQTNIYSPEIKYIDGSISQTLVYTTGAWIFTCINTPCAQGTGVQERVGNKTINKSVHVKGSFNTSGGGGQVYRQVILYDKDNNGTTTTGYALPFTQDNIYAQVNLDNRDRFQTLSDDNYSTNALYDKPIFVDKYLSLELPTIWTGATGTQQYINVGAIVIATCVSGQTLTANSTFSGSYRLRYGDV